MKNILILSTDKFPNGNAGATRQEVIAKLLHECDYCPIVIGLGECTDFKHKYYNGIQYFSYRSRGNSIFSKILNYLLYKYRLKKFILKCEVKFDAILVVSIPLNAFSYIKKFAKISNTILIHDCVEWYSSSEFKLKHLSPEYFKKNFVNKRLIDNNFSVISISSYLERYYQSKNIKTVRIPFVLDVKNTTMVKEINHTKTIFMYAGAMGRKDLLDGFIKAAASLNDDFKNKMEIRIFGVSKDQLIKIGGVKKEDIERLKDTLKIFGRLPKEKIIENLQVAHFTILLRRSKERYAMAGFPTKVVESLASGTPIFCNLSSDLGDYIKDGRECIVVDDLSVETIKNALEKAITLSPADKVNMQHNARICAEENFDYRGYINNMKNLVNKGDI
jgi:glycosyltransferase involved in cell wall biosynthesis